MTSDYERSYVPLSRSKPKRGTKVREPEEQVVRITHDPNDNMHLAYDKRNAGAVEELTSAFNARARRCLGLDPFPAMTHGHKEVRDTLTYNEYEVPAA